MVPIYVNLLPDRLDLPRLGCASSTQAQFSCLPPLFHKTSLGLEGYSYPALLHEIFCFPDSSKDGLIYPLHANENAVVSQGSMLNSSSTEMINEQATSGLKVVTSQLIGSLPNGESGAAGITVAYEPVWAIGTGLTASLGQIVAMHEKIRACLLEKLASS